MSQIDIVLKDEVTGQTEKVRASIRRLRDEVKRTTPIGQKAVDALEKLAYNFGHEIGSAARLVGVTGSLVSGSLVAILANISGRLEQFAADAVTQHAVAREVGMTYENMERLIIAAKAKGVSDEEARAGIEALTRSVRDLALGTRSETRSRLEDAGSDDSGARLARKWQQTLKEAGLDRAVMQVLEHLAKRAGEGEEGRWAAEAIAKSMGLSGPQWYNILDHMQRIQKVAVPSEAEAKKFLLAKRKWDIELSRFKNKILQELTPTMTEFLKYLKEWFSEENSEKLVKFFKDLIEGLQAFPWEDLRKIIDTVLSWVGEEIVHFVEDMAGFFEDLDRFFMMLDRWRDTSIWNRNRDKQILYPNIGGLGTIPMAQQAEPTVPGQAPAQLPPDLEGTPSPTNPLAPGQGGGSPVGGPPEGKLPPGTVTIDEIVVHPGENEDQPQQFMQPQLGNGQRFSRLMELDQADDRLVRQTEGLTFQMRRFVDVLRDLRGGAGGGSSDGGVSKKARSRPLETEAGGRGGSATTKEGRKETTKQERPTPPKPQETEDQRAWREGKLGKQGVAPGAPAPGRHTVKATVFGNYTKELGSEFGWDDPDDKYTSGPMKGQPKPNYGGYAQSVPGVALPYKGSAGPAEKQQGAWVRVWSPDGKTSTLARQVDIGPNQADFGIGLKSRDKGIDINAALAEKLGYVQTKEQSRISGRPVFPSGSRITYQVMTDQDLEQYRIEQKQEQARKVRDAQIAGRSEMDIELNVKGPAGVTADARLEPGGDFDLGVLKVNRFKSDTQDDAMPTM